MTINISPRPTFIFGSRPMLMWNEVEDATSYKFRILNKETSEMLWEIEVSEQLSNLVCEDGFCQCYYPKNMPSLESLAFYSFIAIAETNNGKSLQKFQTEFILLEKNAQEAFENFTELVDKEGTKAIRDQWQVTKEAIADFHGLRADNGTAPPNWDPRHPCLTAFFVRITEG
ncbi:MAG: hypothetical protein WCA35_09235 [Kovacikia sp.]